MHNILLVEDNNDIQAVNSNMLKRRGGYNVRIAMNLAEARKQIKKAMPDIILLDIMLPDGSGLDFLKEVRESTNTPVLILSALGKTQNVIEGLALGGDDYLPKPYQNDELLARIEALMRRSEYIPEAIVKGSLRLELFSNKVYLNGVNLPMTQRDFDLLFLLVQNEDKLLKAEHIYEKVWAQPMTGDKNAFQAAISKLRKKIAPSGYDIEMVRGKGYIFTKI